MTFAIVTADNCFENVEFSAFWDIVGHDVFQLDQATCPDDGWMLDVIVEAFNSEHGPLWAFRMIEEGIRDNDCHEYSIDPAY